MTRQSLITPCDVLLLLLLLQATCDSEKAGNDRRLLNLMGDIAKNCAKRLSLMQDVERVG